MPRLALIALLVLTALIYWSGLPGPLIFDDAHNLAPLTDWLQGRSDWMSVIFDNESGTLGRPVAMASFLLNASLLGTDPWGLKFGNLLIHLINGVLVFAFYRALLRQGALSQGARGDGARLPLLAAATWLLHPLLVSTVLYVVQRMAMLSTLFTLLTLLAYLRGRVAWSDGRRPLARALLIGVVPLCTILATLSKENGILAPALCALLEWFVFAPVGEVKRSRLAKIFAATMLIVPTALVVCLVIAHADLIFAGYVDRPFTFAQRILTQPRVMWDYVGAIIMPGGSRLGLYHDDFTVSRSLFDPPTTLLAILAWGTLLAIAWRLRKPIPALALGLSIFFVGHALESTVFPLLMYFEHRNYFPSIGLIWALFGVLSFALDAARQKMSHPGRILAAGGCALILVLAMTTAARAYVWRDKQALLEQVLRYHTDSRWVRIDLITLAFDQQPPDLASARVHSQHLLASGDLSTRRIGAIEQALVDCTATRQVGPDLLRTMFEGVPEPLEADLITAFETLSDDIVTQPCAGLAPAQMADGLAGLLDRTSLPTDDFGIWRLRFRAANLYRVVDRRDDALKQSRLAYSKTSAAQVPVFIAELLSEKGNLIEAEQMLDAAAPRIARGDVAGQQALKESRERIRALRSAPATQR